MAGRRRRTGNPLISGALFIAVAFVAGFISAAFTDDWVLPVVAGVVAGAAAEWVYAAIAWKTRRRSRRG